MLLKSITLCCLVLNVQTQYSYSSYRSLSQPNPDYIYYKDHPVLPLAATTPNELNKNSQRIEYQNESPNKKKPTSNTVEIQKGLVSEIGSTYEEVSNDDKRNNLVNRQILISAPPSRETKQISGHFLHQISPNRQTTLQTSQDRQRVPQRAQGSQHIPEISLSRPSVAVPQNSLDRPTGPQIQFNPLPSASTNNFPTEEASGFNKLLYSVTNFGINLLKTIHAVHSGNVVVSPFSITSLLGLLQQGSSGQTLAQITTALNMSADATAPVYRQLYKEVRARNSHNILKVANNLFLSDDFAINKEFRNVAINSFNSEVTPISFQKAGDAARQINSWVALKTDNQIPNLLAPDAVDYTTQLVLVNTIYFKGLWDVPFRVESTIPKEFHLSNGQTKTAQFMRMRKMAKTGIDKATNAKVIVLPFEYDEYYLMVVLPNDLMGMSQTLASLTDARLLSYLSFQALDTELELPKFTIKADTDLTVVLQSMGIKNMFRREYSELNGVGGYGAHSPTISSAVHSAMLSIDENGGTAAAATSFAAVALSYDEADIEFKVNRPFIAILWDNRSSLPLFMAKIEDPQQ